MERTNELFKKSVEKCFAYAHNHKRFNLGKKWYLIESNIWDDNFFLYEIIKMDSNQGIIEDKKIIESTNMEDISKCLWNLAGIKIK